jgi:hypothetical protein
MRLRIVSTVMTPVETLAENRPLTAKKVHTAVAAT